MAANQYWMTLICGPSSHTALKTDSGTLPEIICEHDPEMLPSLRVFFREGAADFSKTMLNHILNVLQQHDFVEEELRCCTGLTC